jgi:hypothetical protein
MRAWYRMLLVLGGSSCAAGAAAQEAERGAAPELDFLEYLGAWAEEDDEWLVIEEWQKGDADAGKDAKESDAERKHENDEGE